MKRACRFVGAGLLVLALAFGVLFGPAPLHPPRPLFYPDLDYAEIALGGSPPSFGLNLLCWSAALSPPEQQEDFGALYEAWRSVATRELSGTGALVYPFRSLHVTVSTPAPSLARGHAGWSEAQRTLYRSAWVGALTQSPCVSRQRGGAFPLVMRGLKLLPAPGTAILLFDDPAGQVEELRRCMAARARQLPQAALALVEGAGFAAPRAGFVHATVMRLALPRAEGVTDSDIEARWARAAAAFDAMVLQRVELVVSREALLVEGTELVNLQKSSAREFLLWHAPHTSG
jgi:hypothetical protein